MTKEGHGMNQGWSPTVRRKLQELADLIAEERFGEAGIPKEIAFSEIEEIGHQVGQLAAGTVDQTLQVRHTKHLAEMERCPGCGLDCVIEQRPRRRALQTRDGTIELDEPICHCHACERDFFPSASLAETRRSRV